MIIKLSSVSPSEIHLMEDWISNMRRQGDKALRLAMVEDDRVTLQLSDSWGAEGLEMSYIVLRQLRRFQMSSRHLRK